MLYMLAAPAATLAELGINPQVWLYAGFIALVVVLLMLDLFVFHRHAHVVPMREAIGWSIFWVALALIFGGFVYYIYDHHWLGIGRDVFQLDGSIRDVGGPEAMKLYLTGYLIEKSLSMDNLFVIAMIFTFFQIPREYQHRVLFWGILTAVVLRGVMIAIGAALIHNFEWIVFVFGAFLIYTAIKMAVQHDKEIDPEQSYTVRLVRKFFPVTNTFHGQHFFTREAPGYEGKLVATPLLLALLLVETTDVVFAVDSIPAIFGITADPFIVFTSNIFAILGLRALFFCLAALLSRFHYLSYALILILAFVGVKMLILYFDIHIPTGISLAVVLGLLTLGVVVSLMWPKPVKPEDVPPAALP